MTDALRVMNEGTPVAVAWKDRESRVVHANAAMLDVLGRDASGVYGRTGAERLRPAAAAKMLATDREVVRTHKSLTTEEQSSDGRIWLSTKSPWFGPGGEVIGLLVVAHDITERKRAEAKVRESEAALSAALQRAEDSVRAGDELVSLVSHDLRNPLGALIVGIETLRRAMNASETLEKEKLETTLGRMAQQAGRMHALLDELALVAALHAGGRLDLQPRDTDLVKLTRMLADEMSGLSTSHRLRVETTETTLVGRWDASRIAQVVGNLLSNAVKYSPRGGDVVVEIARVDGDHTNGDAWAILRVTDHGIGIPTDEQARIFEWFTRGRNAERSTIRGSGIGLAGARQIVEQHHGTIAVESTEGKGATFTVKLPLRFAQ